MYSWGWWWWKWGCFALILEARIQNTPSPPQWRCQARWTELSRWTLVMTSSACKPTNATSVSMLHCSNLSKQYGKTQENRTFWSWTMYQIRVTNINKYWTAPSYSANKQMQPMWVKFSENGVEVEHDAKCDPASEKQHQIIYEGRTCWPWSHYSEIKKSEPN